MRAIYYSACCSPRSIIIDQPPRSSFVVVVVELLVLRSINYSASYCSRSIIHGCAAFIFASSSSPRSSFAQFIRAVHSRSSIVLAVVCLLCRALQYIIPRSALLARSLISHHARLLLLLELLDRALNYLIIIPHTSYYCSARSYMAG